MMSRPGSSAISRNNFYSKLMSVSGELGFDAQSTVQQSALSSGSFATFVVAKFLNSCS